MGNRRTRRTHCHCNRLPCTLELGRSALYGTFLAAGIPLQFWPNIFIQAALTLWILALVLRVHRLGGSPVLLSTLIIVLSALTSLRSR